MSQFITSGSRGWADYYSEEGAIFIRIGNLTREHINLNGSDFVRVLPPPSSEGLRTSVKVGDILISITADLGLIGVVPKDLGDAFVNQHIALVRPRDIPLGRFVAHFLCTHVAQSKFARANDSGAKAGLNLPAVGRIGSVIPSNRDEAIAIVEIVDAVDRAVSALSADRAKLRKVKSGLMHDLLTGNIAVAERFETPGPAKQG